MSGLFLNFYHIELSHLETTLLYLNFSDYPTKDLYFKLRDENPSVHFYRYDDKILYWLLNNQEDPINSLNRLNISESIDPKIFSRIIEDSIISFMRNLEGYGIFKNKYSNTWEIISNKDLLNSTISGLEINRVVHFAPYFIKRGENVTFGFTLSTSLKNSFTWTKEEFEQNGIDTKGLKGVEDRIFANKQSIKRFIESKGCEQLYNNVVEKENLRSTCCNVINGFAAWLEKKKDEIPLPNEISISRVIKKYLPFENDLVKSEIIYKPQRYFYSNARNTQNLRFYDQMVKAYKPYSLELYQNKPLSFGIICPQEYQGETELFLKKIEAKLKEIFHFQSINFNLITPSGNTLESYKSVLYDDELLKSDLVYVIVSMEHERLPESESPYHVCKAKLIGNGIPTQDIQIETIRQKTSLPIMSNISLNTYAKLGGTAWTIEREEKIREELVIGIGSTIGKDGQHVLGIAQVFHNDGRYIMGDCAPLSSFDDYAQNLETHLYNTLKPLIDEMKSDKKIRLIFHLFKSAGEEYEIKAINNVKDKFSDDDIEYALVHLGYGHNFRLYYNDGKNDVSQGTYIQLNKYSALLHFVPKSDLPLKIDLDSRSTFTSLFYLAKQVYWFSHLSHRSYIPAKKTVTIMYPSLMAKMTQELKKVEGWDYDRLKAVSEKLWFI